jgi:hypothetical protein
MFLILRRLLSGLTFSSGDACQPFMFTPGDVMVSNAAINGLDFAAETPGFFCWLKC